jgi:hypothetical protein
MFLKKKKEMPGLTPAAWRKAAAQEMGLDYDTYLALWKANKGAAKAVKMVPESTPTVPAASSSSPTMGFVPKAPINATYVNAKSAVEDLKAALKSGDLDASDVDDIMNDMIIEYGSDSASKQMIINHKAIIKAQMTETDKVLDDVEWHPLSINMLDQADEYVSAFASGKISAEKAISKINWFKSADPSNSKKWDEALHAIKGDVLTPDADVIQTIYGPLTHDLAQDVYKKMKKDLPGATPATWRHMASEYLGVDYNDYLKSWKKPTTAAQKAKQTPTSKMHPVKTSVSPSNASKYDNKTLTVESLKNDLSRLYGPGAKPEFIDMSYDDIAGAYRVQFPNSLLPTQASKDAVADGLRALGLKVEKKGSWYHISTKQTVKSAQGNVKQIKSTGTYTLPDGRVVLDMNKADDWTEAWWKTLTSSQQQAWKTYTGSGYRSINQGLRGGGSLTSTAQRIRQSMVLTEHEFMVFRGTNIPIGEFKVGSLWEDMGFMSTAVNPGSAWSGVKFDITLPKGVRGMYIGKRSSHSHENEFLIDAGTKFRILSVDVQRKVVKMVAIPKG